MQTEDSGVDNPHIFTHLFHGGVIISSKKANYAADEPVENVRAMMQAQHKALLKLLVSGSLDDKIRQYLGATSKDFDDESEFSSADVEPGAPKVVIAEPLPAAAKRPAPAPPAARVSSPAPPVPKPATPRPGPGTPPASWQVREPGRVSTQQDLKPSAERLARGPTPTAPRVSPILPSGPPRRGGLGEALVRARQQGQPPPPERQETAELFPQERASVPGSTVRPARETAPKGSPADSLPGDTIVSPPRFPGTSPRLRHTAKVVPDPSGGAVVVSPPSVIVGKPGTRPPAHRQVPRSAPRETSSRSPGSSSVDKAFGAGLISEKSLDEVILAYLSEDQNED